MTSLPKSIRVLRPSYVPVRLRFRAQPVTRAFVITQGPDSNGVYYFSKDAIDTWYDNNSDNVTKVSEGMYIVSNDANFGSVVGNVPMEGILFYTYA